MLLILSKKAQQRLYLLRRLRSFGLTTQVRHAQLLQSCNRECSGIFYHNMVWVDYTEGNAQIKQSCENCSRIIGRDLPSLEILYQQRLLGRATLISQDSSHPAHNLFEPLPSSRRFRYIKTRTNRFSTSFSP